MARLFSPAEWEMHTRPPASFSSRYRLRTSMLGRRWRGGRPFGRRVHRGCCPLNPFDDPIGSS